MIRADTIDCPAENCPAKKDSPCGTHDRDIGDVSKLESNGRGYVLRQGESYDTVPWWHVERGQKANNETFNRGDHSLDLPYR